MTASPFFSRNIDLDSLKDEIEDGQVPELVAQLKALPDHTLSDALEQAFAAYEDEWYALLDNVRYDAIENLIYGIQNKEASNG